MSDITKGFIALAAILVIAAFNASLALIIFACILAIEWWRAGHPDN